MISTDGVGVSILFIRYDLVGKRLPNAKKGVSCELYIDELNDYSGLQDKKIVAIDIGGSNIRLLVSDLDGNIISTSMESTPIESGRKAILSKIKVLYEKALAENKIKPSDIGSIVAGSPGTIDPNTGEITRTYNLPDWENFSLSDELSP
jgi:hypothetical protein